MSARKLLPVFLSLMLCACSQPKTESKKSPAKSAANNAKKPADQKKAKEKAPPQKKEPQKKEPQKKADDDKTPVKKKAAQAKSATVQLPDPAPRSKRLEVGEKAPNFNLAAQDGKKHALSDLLKKGNVAIVFYRSANW